MTDLYERQVLLEEEYTVQGVIASQKQVLDAYAQGRAADVGRGRILVAKAFDQCIEPYKAMLNAKVRGGHLSKYLGLLRGVDPEVVIMATLRIILRSVTQDGDNRAGVMQNVLSTVGKTIELESLIQAMGVISEQYTKRTVEYLDTKSVGSVGHRYRTMLVGADTLGLNWNHWTSEERVHVGRLVLTLIYDETGLFKWQDQGTGALHITPTEELAKYLNEAVDSARAVRCVPPMLVPPMERTDYYNGGYLTESMRMQNPMCTQEKFTRDQIQFIRTGLAAPEAQPVRDAMNKAQSVAYRVNTQVLEILREALALGVGILGLPSTVGKPKPVFPFDDTFDKAEATEAQLDEFTLWKRLCTEWYTAERKRVGRSCGLLSKMRELIRFKDEPELYFPTFIDWRGRLYFRSSLNPQSDDALKGCLEFAEGKPLGIEGLYWLKVHVANCCGYDKHDPDIKVQWVEDNWEMISDFINNPLDVDAPEPNTAFTLLQAGLALQSAMQCGDPTLYICHVPVAMDATCSGLQHLSALTRDTVGAKYTNLIDSDTDQKADIYMQVGTVAESLKSKFIPDVLMSKYWSDKPITRAMSKKPVMTYVYGSTLLSTIDSLSTDMVDSGFEALRDQDGELLYTLNKLAVPIGKALRKGVELTVPKSAEMMKYLQRTCRNKPTEPIKWITPVGVPVINWSSVYEQKLVFIRSMGVTAIRYGYRTDEYNKRVAVNGIVPNFVHSMDSAHLCMTLNAADCSILPIHDSFGTHPSDVPKMHTALRETFVELYSQFDLEKFLIDNGVDLEAEPLPPVGDLDLNEVKKSRFMFC